MARLVHMLALADSHGRNECVTAFYRKQPTCLTCFPSFHFLPREVFTQMEPLLCPPSSPFRPPRPELVRHTSRTTSNHRATVFVCNPGLHLVGSPSIYSSIHPAISPLSHLFPSRNISIPSFFKIEKAIVSKLGGE